MTSSIQRTPSSVPRTEDFATWARMRVATALLSAARRALFDVDLNEVNERLFTHCVQIASRVPT